jgi:hypothetical protein
MLIKLNNTSYTLLPLHQLFLDEFCSLLYSTVQISTYCSLSTVQYSTEQNRTEQNRTVQYSTVQYSTVPYRTVPYRTVPYRTVPYRTVLYCTVLYPTVPYCTLLYPTVLFCTLLWLLSPDPLRRRLPGPVSRLLVRLILPKCPFYVWNFGSLLLPYIRTGTYFTQ